LTIVESLINISITFSANPNYKNQTKSHIFVGCVVA
jgi:hypothetical protein